MDENLKIQLKKEIMDEIQLREKETQKISYFLKSYPLTTLSFFGTIIFFVFHFLK